MHELDCYKCNNHGHITRDCKLMAPTEKVSTKEFQDKKIEKGLEEKERGGDIHVFSMYDIKVESMTY